MRSFARLLTSTLLVAAIAVAVAVVPANAVQSFQDRVVVADPADWTPNVLDGRVNAIVVVGTTAIAGGTFSQVQAPGGAVLTRSRLVAFDAATGAIDPGFTPGVNGKVLALATDGTSVFVGGQFSKANGRTAQHLVRLDLQGRTVRGFDAPVTGGTGVYDLVIGNGLLYIGGAFSSVGGTARNGLAAVDPTTGAVAPGVDLAFTGLHNGGESRVAKLDVSPDGTALVAVGNFTTVAGQPRDQIALADLGSGGATLSAWSTQRYVPQCTPKFDTYIRDVDISPDGAYFVVVTTGAFRGGADAGVLCDTASRWELHAAGPDRQPSWVDYAGGDTTYSVAVTGTAVYVGGHFRWWNNPFAGDTVGPGTVKRSGIAALDPLNGLPLSWNPGRKLGEGVFSLVATPEGLWVGNDSDQIGGEYHARLAFFPLAGGTSVPVAQPATLPGGLYSLPATGCATADPSILYRVNTGGALVPSQDCGADWAADDGTTGSPYRNAGSSAATWNPVPAVDGTLPASTPAVVFATERWDPSSSPEMRWDFPVQAGTRVRVRLYVADRCSCTDGLGKRVFDVALDGTPVLHNFDIVAAVGHDVGTMRSFDVTSDGSVTIDFSHVVENPLVNAIELVNLDATPIVPAPAEFLGHRSFDGAIAGARSTLGTPGVDWSHARGAFFTNGRIYTGRDDGTMSARTFNGTTVGKATSVYLRGLTASQFPVSSVTGMALDAGRLYYTVSGDARLFYRYFTPESGVVGAQTFVVTGPDDGFEWDSARGITLAGGTLFVARADGSLESIAWTPGTDHGAPVPGSRVLVDANPAQLWTSRGMFVRN